MTASAPDEPRPRSAGARSVSANADLGRYAGLGFQFAFTLLLFGAAGWWVDGKLATAPWLMILGIFLGAGLAFYSLVRAVNRSPRPPSDIPPAPNRP